MIEEATPEALAGAGVDVFFFAIGAAASRELAPHAVRGGAVVLDKSSAWRMEPDVPLVVPEVNGARALEHDGIIAVPNCSTIPLTVVLKPLHDEAGVAGCGWRPTSRPPARGASAWRSCGPTAAGDHDLAMDWDYDGEEFDEETKIREETRKIMELPELPVSATCVRVPVLVGHSEAVWIETEQPLSAERARDLLGSAPGVRIDEFPTPGNAAGTDDVLVGRIRPDRAGEGALAVPLLRQPPQGRGPQRDPDSGARARGGDLAARPCPRDSPSAVSESDIPGQSGAPLLFWCDGDQPSAWLLGRVRGTVPEPCPLGTGTGTGFAGAKTSRSRASTDARLPASTG